MATLVVITDNKIIQLHLIMPLLVAFRFFVSACAELKQKRRETKRKINIRMRFLT